MIQIIFEISVALFTVIGLICVFNELAKIIFADRKIGKAELTVIFNADADKRAYVNKILSDTRLDLTIKIPHESLSDFDRAELDDLIEKGKIIIF